MSPWLLNYLVHREPAVWFSWKLAMVLNGQGVWGRRPSYHARLHGTGRIIGLDMIEFLNYKTNGGIFESIWLLTHLRNTMKNMRVFRVLYEQSALHKEMMKVWCLFCYCCDWGRVFAKDWMWLVCCRMKLSVSAFRAHASAQKKILGPGYQSSLHYGSTSCSTPPAHTTLDIDPQVRSSYSLQ